MSDPNTYTIISQKEAKTLGLKHYFTGKPCKYGHISKRHIGGICVACGKERNAKEKEKDPQARLEYHRQWYRKNREYMLNYMHKYGQENKAECYARSQLRKKRIKRATPPWSDLKAIVEIYKESERITCETGIQHNVDHIIPLIHPLVCGLHVPANLQILTEEENLKKSNKFQIE